MDFIDHLIYTTSTDKVRNNFPVLLSDNVNSLNTVIGGGNPNGTGLPGSNENPIVPPVALPPIDITGTFPLKVREGYVFYLDPDVIDKAIQKHWFDMINGPISLLGPGGTQQFQQVDPPIYHLIYSYLVENSRIYQIIERLIYLYQHDEILGVASAGDDTHQKAFQWIVNTENLFFKTLSNTSYRNIAGNLRPNPEASRRNAYYRLFGMDLAFGEPSGSTGTDYSYYKAKTVNKGFIILLEGFIAEIWQAYINAKNSSGANTTDYQKIVDMAEKIREMLMARRGATGTISLQNYKFMNLSKEEYASVGFMTWLFFAVSYDSPLVTFLGCQANTTSERLSNLGRKVGIEAHVKTQALFDMAAPLATVLRQVEYGTFESTNTVTNRLWIQEAIESQTGLITATPEEAAALVDLLTIINNWEKATGHRIKNPEAHITGVVNVRSNGLKTPAAAN